MNIRAQVYGSRPGEPILRGKQPKGAKGDELDSVTVQREESRRGNSRTADRHRLSEETVRVVHHGAAHEAQLINLSDGGAMIRGALDVKLWDAVELHLGDDGMIECAVRWMRGDRIGLEFAHETRLDCSSDEVATVLREVISRSFPDVTFDRPEQQEADADPVSDEAEPEDLPERRQTDRRVGERRTRTPPSGGAEHRREPRHPLIWSGTLHLENQSAAVRIRNISATGALIDCNVPVAVGDEPVLELNDQATIASTVQWVVGNQVGVRFHRPFDMQLLARSKPQITPAATWVRPAYLDMLAEESAESDPWDPRWKRLTLREINLELEGFLKR